MKWISYLCTGSAAILILTSCFINPHDKSSFDEFHNQGTSLLGNLIFYHFNEPFYTGVSGDIIDSSGLGKNSTSVGGLEKEQGIYGYGIRCQGSSGVNLEVADFDLAFSERTISVWFVSFDNSSTHYIFEEGGTVNGINIYIENGLLYGHTYKANGGDFQQWHTYPVETNTWYHAVITFNATDGFLLYINGEVTGPALSLGGFSMPSHGNANGLCILNDDSRRHNTVESNNTGAHPLNGILDELAVWNRTLTPAEILNLYKRQGRI